VYPSVYPRDVHRRTLDGVPSGVRAVNCAHLGP